jgi:Tol biopolymer transport system component
MSPDGKTIAFLWTPPPDSNSENWGIYLKSISGGSPRPFALDHLPMSPRWSPDGKWIAFFRWGTPRTARLAIKPASGGDERTIGTICNSNFAWSADSSSIIAAENGDTDLTPEECRLTIFGRDKGSAARKLGISAINPALSPDGRTLAYAWKREIHLLPVGPDGRLQGRGSILVTEPQPIGTLTWASGDEIAYTFSTDRSAIRAIAVQPASKPRKFGSVDGDIYRLVFGAGGLALADAVLHDNSYWRLDLQSSGPRFEKLRQLPRNADNLRVSPDGNTVVYSVSTDGESEVWTSNTDGTRARRLFRIPFEDITTPSWSPDGKQIVFTAERLRSQTSVPTHLFIASLTGDEPRNVHLAFEVVHSAYWSHDGKELVLSSTDSVWRMQVQNGALSKVIGTPPRVTLSGCDGNFLYLTHEGPGRELSRLPLAGGSEERLTDVVLQFDAGRRGIYYMRQDAKPPTKEGLNLYRFDLATRASLLIANVGFGLASLQASADERYIYAMRKEPQRQQVMVVNGLR